MGKEKFTTLKFSRQRLVNIGWRQVGALESEKCTVTDSGLMECGARERS
jgi:hypothetical protein